MIYFKSTVELDRANVFLSFKKTLISTLFPLNDKNDKNNKINWVFGRKIDVFQVEFMRKVYKNRCLKNQILAIFERKILFFRNFINFSTNRTYVGFFVIFWGIGK